MFYFLALSSICTPRFVPVFPLIIRDHKKSGCLPRERNMYVKFQPIISWIVYMSLMCIHTYLIPYSNAKPKTNLTKGEKLGTRSN